MEFETLMRQDSFGWICDIHLTDTVRANAVYDYDHLNHLTSLDFKNHKYWKYIIELIYLLLENPEQIHYRYNC